MHKLVKFINHILKHNLVGEKGLTTILDLEFLCFIVIIKLDLLL